jgi:hypothetical protein
MLNNPKIESQTLTEALSVVSDTVARIASLQIFSNPEEHAVLGSSTDLRKADV